MSEILVKSPGIHCEVFMSPQTVQWHVARYFHAAISKLDAGIGRVCLLDRSLFIFNQVWRDSNTGIHQSLAFTDSNGSTVLPVALLTAKSHCVLLVLS